MKLNKISNSEFSANKISSLPIRPNEASRYGLSAMSADELKKMFDANADLLRLRINSIIDYISNEGENGIASEILTGVPELPTLKSLCEGILDGTFAATLTLTEEYSLLDFATKMMNLVFPEQAIEFLKVLAVDGVYTLPARPYENHENAVYIIPSHDTTSLFDCYVWENGAWQLWSTGSLQSYVSELEEMLNTLWTTAARASDVSYLKTVKADETDLLAIASKIDAMCSGSPIAYKGTLEALQEESKAKKDVIYLITNPTCPNFGCWCYHDGTSWVVGGKYVANTYTTGSVQRYDDSPVSSGAVKSYVDEAISDALDGIALDYSGWTNMFDKHAIIDGRLDEDGSIVTDSDYVITDYIDVTVTDDIYISCQSPALSRQAFPASGYLLYTFDRVAFPDSHMFFRSSYVGASIKIDKDEFPDARLIRVIFKKADYENAVKVMINEGTSARKYAPYREFELKLDQEISETSSKPAQSKAVYEFVQKKAHSVKWQFGSNTAFPFFDTNRNRLIFNRECDDDEWGIMLDGYMYRFEGGVSAEIDISRAVTHTQNGSTSDSGVVYLNANMLKQFTPSEPALLTSAFSVRDADYHHTDENAIPIATFKRGADGFGAWMDCPFYIDGKLFGVCADTDKMEQRLYIVEDDISYLLGFESEARQSLEGMEDSVSSLNRDVSGLVFDMNNLGGDVETTSDRLLTLESDVKDIDERLKTAEWTANVALEATYQIGYTHIDAPSMAYLESNDSNVVPFFIDENSDGNPYMDVYFMDTLYKSNAIRANFLLPANPKPIAFSLYAPDYSKITIFYTGDDCQGGEFIPQANTEYSLFLWRCGKFRCHVIASR